MLKAASIQAILAAHPKYSSGPHSVKKRAELPESLRGVRPATRRRSGLWMLWLGEIAVRQRDVVPGGGEALLQSFGDDDGPMASPRASNADIQVTPTLAFE